MAATDPTDAAAAPRAPSRFAVWGRLGGGLALAVLVLLVVSFFRGPATTLQALREASQTRNTTELARHIDGEALRHSLGRLLLQQTGAALSPDTINDRQLLSQFIVAGALVREESRGSHWRTDFPARDDQRWLKHTMARYAPEGPQFSYTDVEITDYEPKARTY